VKSSLCVLLLGWSLVACSPEDVSFNVKVAIPADVTTIPSGVLRLSLLSYEPLLADAPATLVDLDTALFTHQSGQRNEFRMHIAGHIESGLRYYISVRGFERTPEGERYVLWDGLEAATVATSVTMRMVPAAASIP
jgi:hypothetical protein